MTMATHLIVLLAGVTVVLSGSCLYALMSFTVTERTRETGIRTTLGAPRANIVLLAGKRAFLRLSAGVLIGATLIALRVLVCVCVPLLDVHVDPDDAREIVVPPVAPKPAFGLPIPAGRAGFLRCPGERLGLGGVELVVHQARVLEVGVTRVLEGLRVARVSLGRHGVRWRGSGGSVMPAVAALVRVS